MSLADTWLPAAPSSRSNTPQMPMTRHGCRPVAVPSRSRKGPRGELTGAGRGSRPGTSVSPHCWRGPAPPGRPPPRCPSRAAVRPSRRSPGRPSRPGRRCGPRARTRSRSRCAPPLCPSGCWRCGRRVRAGLSPAPRTAGNRPPPRPRGSPAGRAAWSAGRRTSRLPAGSRIPTPTGSRSP